MQPVLRIHTELNECRDRVREGPSYICGRKIRRKVRVRMVTISVQWKNLTPTASLWISKYDVSINIKKGVYQTMKRNRRKTIKAVWPELLRSSQHVSKDRQRLLEILKENCMISHQRQGFCTNDFMGCLPTWPPLKHISFRMKTLQICFGGNY